MWLSKIAICLQINKMRAFVQCSKDDSEEKQGWFRATSSENPAKSLQNLMSGKLQPYRIVDPFDELLQMCCKLFHRVVRAGFDFFPLQCLDEALTAAVLPWTACPAHAQYRAAALQQVHVLHTRILRALIRMMDEPWRGMAQCLRTCESLHRQTAL